MANEVNMSSSITQENPWPFTVDDTIAVAKGAVMMMTDPRVAIIATNGPVPVAGICAREKVALDTKTELGMHRRGWFFMTLSGSASIGQALMVSASATTYPNHVELAAVTASGATIIGHALETGTNGQTILVDVNIGGNGRV